VKEVYITTNFIVVPFCLIAGTALLAYGYSCAVKRYGDKHSKEVQKLTNQEYRVEADRYAYFVCNGLYLAFFLVFQYIISFNRIQTFQFLFNLFIITFLIFQGNSNHIHRNWLSNKLHCFNVAHPLSSLFLIIFLPRLIKQDETKTKNSLT
jgi:cell division protein FtsW (lipid II flippase)